MKNCDDKLLKWISRRRRYDQGPGSEKSSKLLMEVTEWWMVF